MPLTKRRAETSTFWGLAVPLIGLVLLGVYFPSVWGFSFSFLVSFAVADVIMYYSLEKGTGAKWAHGARSEIRIWIVLFVIVVASLAGAKIGEFVTGLNAVQNYWLIVGEAFLTVVTLYVYLAWRYNDSSPSENQIPQQS